jgi:hypothetical protein
MGVTETGTMTDEGNDHRDRARRSRENRGHTPDQRDIAGQYHVIRCFTCGDTGVRASVVDDIEWARPCRKRPLKRG